MFPAIGMHLAGFRNNAPIYDCKLICISQKPVYEAYYSGIPSWKTAVSGIPGKFGLLLHHRQPPITLWRWLSDKSLGKKQKASSKRRGGPERNLN